jgi:hypothetical protein
VSDRAKELIEAMDRAIRAGELAQSERKGVVGQEHTLILDEYMTRLLLAALRLAEAEDTLDREWPGNPDDEYVSRMIDATEQGLAAYRAAKEPK